MREVAGALIRICKDRDITLLLVGHVTKDGSIAGPRLLEHIVDVVLQFEGERHSRLRLIRAIKNRFGASDEVGCFDLSDTGIESVLDPTGLFTSPNQSIKTTGITIAPGLKYFVHPNIFIDTNLTIILAKTKYESGTSESNNNAYFNIGAGVAF